jgi:DNA-binding PadR family transcriptional regulator
VKGDRLGEFEELLLLALQALGDEPSVVSVQQYLEGVTGRNVSLGAVYAGLDRLELKGFVRSAMGDPTAERGGKRKRLFAVTGKGRRTVADVRRVREAMWHAIETAKDTR